jgi:hypothetical protein
VTEHSSSQNRVDRLNAAPTGYQIQTENSPSQNRVDRVNAAPTGYQIVTENSPSQNRVDRLNAPPGFARAAFSRHRTGGAVAISRLVRRP